ncbi:MAG: tetratricopeptide repeat protein [Bacteroidaceae bacterium]|jgi:tetratricopeptide (TPR) repeat protein|nr:tetratricopeptide repeat protein [Bacteroidaceae bacterium]
MKKLFVSMAFVLVAGSAFAQMDAVKNATKAANKGDFATATSLIEQALNNPETANLADTWYAAGQVQQKISAKQLENQVKRQNFDEGAMQNAALQMVKYFLKADQLPDQKGKMNAFTSKMASAIKADMGNLINGGVAAFNGGGEGSDQKALDFFGTYVSLADAPMFEKENMKADPQFATIAYYAALAGIRSENYPAVEQYAPMAQADPENGQNATEFLVEALKKQNKTDQMLTVLKDALDKFPGNQAFFANMIDYYTSADKYDEAQAFADQMIAKDPSNYFYNYVKGFLFSQQKNDDKAIEQYEQAIQKNPEYAQAYAELGKSWVLKAQDFSETASSNPNDPKFAEDAKTLRSFYEKAMPYLEKARELASDNVSLWKQALSSVYYNLQMTDKYEEVQQAY